MTICENHNEYRYDSGDNSSGKYEVKRKDQEILSHWRCAGSDNPVIPGGILSSEAEKMMEIWKAGGGWRFAMKDWRKEIKKKQGKSRYLYRRRSKRTFEMHKQNQTRKILFALLLFTLSRYFTLSYVEE